MNPAERRELGAHYTSEENIMKVIKPLFLDELREEFERIKGNSRQLELFHDKLSRLKFLDPACGCGNFLIITYKEVRLLELEVLKMLYDNLSQLQMIEIKINCKVNVDQFFGIEYEEFPCQIARVGMWLMDHQMNMRVAEHFGTYFARLPLKQAAAIVNGNALRIDWESVVPKHELSFILGNPPFSGARLMNPEQKEDMGLIFGDTKGVGNLDYVTAWYKKAADYIAHTRISVAFVSTNSISQGEQVAILWKPLIEESKIIIDFGYRTFKWSNEAKGKAAVHCVIVGFSAYDRKKSRYIFESDGTVNLATNINPYLVNADNIFVANSSSALCNVPAINYGSFALDDGAYTIDEDEYNIIIQQDENCQQFLRPFIGARELLHSEKRYCVWLKNVNPKSMQSSPVIMEKVKKVKDWRSKSNRKNTVELAKTPTLFAEIRQPETPYLAIPTVCSEKRNYIPIMFLSPEIIASNQLYIVSNATLYHFGVLTSNIHMAWMRAVCGRLEMRYRYSSSIVYNTFPWPEPTDIQKQAIEHAAQGVLDARALYPESSLADLYDPLTMPPELTKAHNGLDRAVKAAYGGKSFATEAERVADLMERYQNLMEGKK